MIAVASVLATLIDKDTEPNAKAESLERKLVAENKTKAACQVFFEKEFFTVSNDILNTIYRHYVDDAFEGIQALDFDDLQTAYANLDEFEKKHNISLSEHNNFETDILSEITKISELKGFTNGFKLSVRLIFEVFGTSSYISDQFTGYTKREKAERT